MKTLPTAILLIIILSGCGKSSSEQAQAKQIADLQMTVSNLETALATNQNVTVYCLELCLSNDLAQGDINLRQAEQGDALGKLLDISTNLDGRVSLLEDWHYAVFMTHNLRAGTPPAETPNSSNNFGVPDDVLSQIKTKAQQEWPSDFDMQNYVIGKQVAAWKQLNPRP